MLEKLNPFWWVAKLLDTVATDTRHRVLKVLEEMEFHVEITRLGDNDHRLIGEKGALGTNVPLRFKVVPHELVQQIKEKRSS